MQIQGRGTKTIAKTFFFPNYLLEKEAEQQQVEPHQQQWFAGDISANVDKSGKKEVCHAGQLISSSIWLARGEEKGEDCKEKNSTAIWCWPRVHVVHLVPM